LEDDEMKKQWIVFVRKSVTQRMVDGPWYFDSKIDAEQYAKEYNRNCQDDTWNRPVAVVHNLAEKLRA
jgi:hypothetical protein